MLAFRLGQRACPLTSAHPIKFPESAPGGRRKLHGESEETAVDPVSEEIAKPSPAFTTPAFTTATICRLTRQHTPNIIFRTSGTLSLSQLSGT
jgi:hypothetical protein